jgi:hypothetical protein
MSQIFRSLPDNEYQAAINANSPSAANPFLTAADVPTPAYAAYHSNPLGLDQTAGAGVPTPMIYDVVDFQSNIVLTVSGSSFQVGLTGIYNIQFSAQLQKSGGTTAETYFWLQVNSTAVPSTNTVLTLANNGHKVVAAWNWMVPLGASDVVELMWTSDTGATILLNEVPAIGPEIPAVIVTIEKVN